MSQDVLVIPSARRMMESLRDIGYDLPAAVADLVDNALDAMATCIDVHLHWDGEDSWLRVTDNGTGMTAARLDEAMRYGSARAYEANALGRFGLGLKTASLSQCRVLSVASRTDASSRPEVRRWDLDRVGELDQWSLERLAISDAPAALIAPIRHVRGTVVMWERLDRVVGYKLPGGVAAEHGFAVTAVEIAAHLGMVFHRFLDGSARRRRRLRIRVNGQDLEAWDPFCCSEKATRRLPQQFLGLRHGARQHRITVRPFVLPNQHQFSSQRAREIASGPLRWNRQQGFYIYRRDRLIQSGGWNRLRTTDEHTKLARIAVDIPPAADDAFEVNVAKMHLLLPAELRAPMKTIASGVAQFAQEVYRGGRPDWQDQRPVEVAHLPGVAVHSRPRIGWGAVERVLRRELVRNPAMCDRILAALIVESHAAAEAKAVSSAPKR
jgi:hypothetical protein